MYMYISLLVLAVDQIFQFHVNSSVAMESRIILSLHIYLDNSDKCLSG